MNQKVLVKESVKFNTSVKLQQLHNDLQEANAKTINCSKFCAKKCNETYLC